MDFAHLAGRSFHDHRLRFAQELECTCLWMMVTSAHHGTNHRSQAGSVSSRRSTTKMPFIDDDDDPYEKVERREVDARRVVPISPKDKEPIRQTVAQQDQCASSSNKRKDLTDEFDEYLVDYNEWTEEECKKAEAKNSSTAKKSPTSSTRSIFDQSSASTSSQSQSASSAASHLTESEIQMAQFDELIKEKGISMETLLAYVDQRRGTKRPPSILKGPRKVRKLGVGLAARPVKSKKEVDWEEWEKTIEKEREEMRNGPHRQYYSPLLDQLCDCELKNAIRAVPYAQDIHFVDKKPTDYYEDDFD
jgi:hypothetical protein